MYLSNEGILMILLVGLIAGWLAGKIVRGTGIGLIGDMAIGIVGAFIASWLLPQLGIGLGSGLIRAIINATIGAALLLTIIRLLEHNSDIGGVSSPSALQRAVLYGAQDHTRRDRDHVTAIEDNPSSEGNDDPHDEVIRLEALAAEIESCRKFILTSNFSLGQSAWAGMQP